MMGTVGERRPVGFHAQCDARGQGAKAVVQVLSDPCSFEQRHVYRALSGCIEVVVEPLGVDDQRDGAVRASMIRALASARPRGFAWAHGEIGKTV